MPAAHRNDVSLASVPIVMLLAIVSVNRNDSWNTSATLARSASRVTSVRSTPPTRTTPLSGRSRPASSSHSVVLPHPVGPTSATTSPGAMRTSQPCSTGVPATYPYSSPSASTSSGPSGSACGSRRNGFRRRREHAVDAIERDHRTRHLLEQESDDAHREREQREQRHRLHEVAGRHRAGRHPPSADCEQHDDGEVRERVEGRLEERAQRTDTDRAPRAAASAAPASRSTSASWRPSVFTTIAPSKLSCVIAETSPTRSCTVCAGSSTRRV